MTQGTACVQLCRRSIHHNYSIVGGASEILTQGRLLWAAEHFAQHDVIPFHATKVVHNEKTQARCETLKEMSVSGRVKAAGLRSCQDGVCKPKSAPQEAFSRVLHYRARPVSNAPLFLFRWKQGVVRRSNQLMETAHETKKRLDLSGNLKVAHDRRESFESVAGSP